MQENMFYTCSTSAAAAAFENMKLSNVAPMNLKNRFSKKLLHRHISVNPFTS